MANENEVQDEELKLREDPDGSVVVGDEPPEDNDDEDESLKANDSSDEEGHAEETSEERAARTERNRARRKESKERRKDYVESLRRDLAARDTVINEMSQRLSVVERKSSGSEMAQLENAEKEAVQHYNHFKSLHGQAIEQANGQVAQDSMEKMFDAKKRYEQIQSIKKSMTQQSQQPAPLDPRLAAQAQTWMENNSWYDPSGKDEDSSVVLAIDNRLAAQGWNPTTPEYWQELDSRVKKYLPHKQNSSYNKPQGRNGSPRSPVASSGRESSAPSAGTYKLSAERVQALKDSGMWDDPKSRAEAIRRYQSYDKESRT